MRGKALTVEERDEILRWICDSCRIDRSPLGLGRNQSVISREITRNGGRDAACTAHSRSPDLRDDLEITVSRPRVDRVSSEPLTLTSGHSSAATPHASRHHIGSVPSIGHLPYSVGSDTSPMMT